jgi:PRC-barrel domain
MTSMIEDISSLPGKKVVDHESNPIGEIQEIYAQDGEDDASWVVIEAKFGMFFKRKAFIPLSRLKWEGDDIQIPYGKSHIEHCPEIDADGEISKEDERKLRDHYGLDRSDQELITDNTSYVMNLPENEGTPKKVDDPEQLSDRETPEAPPPKEWEDLSGERTDDEDRTGDEKDESEDEDESKSKDEATGKDQDGGENVDEGQSQAGDGNESKNGNQEKREEPRAEGDGSGEESDSKSEERRSDASQEHGSGNREQDDEERDHQSGEEKEKQKD